MNLMIEIGLGMVLFSLLLAAYTANFFGFSKKQRHVFHELENKEELTPAERADLNYFWVNEKIRHSWKVVFVAGMILLVLGSIVEG